MDQKYIDGLAKGDSACIKEIYKKCFSMIEIMIEQNNGTKEDAKDIFQEAMIAMFYKATSEKIQLTCSVCSFLYLICKRKWLNELKKRRIGLTFLDKAGYTYKDDIVKSIDELLLAEAQMKLIEKNYLLLNTKCQEIIALSYGDRLLKEVAEILGTTHGAVRTEKCECMKKLVKLIQNDEDFKNLKL